LKLKGRTSIIIAYRLLTIRHADEIIVIDKGEIVERGKHDDLKIADDVYEKLYDLQSF
jgi:ABC-type multidrug transport system fused ATPase/permease subunit